MDEQEQKIVKTIVNVLTNDMTGMCNKRKMDVWDCGIAPEYLGFLCKMVVLGYLPRKNMLSLLEKYINEEKERRINEGQN
jgi:Asp-tRNA(Asn)/Glu-tRNA(Gln) amidotransferase B subunit